MVTEQEHISASLNRLKSRGQRFIQCLNLLSHEEADTNDGEAKDAWKIILRKHLAEMHALLEELKQRIAWSLLDDRALFFKELYGELQNGLNSYKEYEDEKTRKTINNIILLIKEGKGLNGFRQSFVNDTYFVDVFNKELERFRNEEESIIEVNYVLDSKDEVCSFSNDNDLKKHMVRIRRNELFNTRFGKVYHNTGRNIKKLASYIIDLKLDNFCDIYDFMRCYVALQMAEEKLKEENVEVIPNLVFKDNVDVGKLIRKLGEFVEKEIISAQKHWYIVYKVFKTKNWLASEIQRKFIEQINSSFGERLKCTKADFKEVDSYFKNNAYAEWSLDAPKTPPCCTQYREIALRLDEEFQDNKYAKPGTMINTLKPVKIR